MTDEVVLSHEVLMCLFSAPIITILKNRNIRDEGNKRGDSKSGEHRYSGSLSSNLFLCSFVFP